MTNELLDNKNLLPNKSMARSIQIRADAYIQTLDKTATVVSRVARGLSARKHRDTLKVKDVLQSREVHARAVESRMKKPK